MAQEESVGNIAVVGERALVLGFRLIGLENSFIAEGGKGREKLLELYKSKKYSLIMASSSIKSELDRKTQDSIETSTNPLVVFIPLPGGEEEESVAELAKRILGVDING